MTGSIRILIVFLATGVIAEAGILSGAFSPIATGSNVDLTIEGKLDWVHWGLHTDSSLHRKMGVSPQISDYSLLGSGVIYFFQYADNYNTYTWHDGFPAAAVTNTQTGVWAYQAYPPVLTGSGFQITVPADTTLRTLQLYVGTFAARGRLEATLSDGGLPYTDTSLFNTANGPGGVYALNYQAHSGQQTLTVKWTLYQRAAGTNSISGNVTLQAAALTAPDANNPPMVALASPVHLSSFAAPAQLALQAASQDFDGSVTNVTFFHENDALAQSSLAPYDFLWTNVPIGHYTLRALAQDNLGASRYSTAKDSYVYGSGGQLNATVTTGPAGVDLTAEGTADWIHWGLSTNTSVNRKSGVLPQIPNFTSLGTNPIVRYGDNATSFSWSDGTPTSATTNPTPTGIYVTGIDNGFELRLPADPSPRTAKVYTGGYGVQAELTAFLSDLSAPPYFDHTVSNLYDNVGVVYTFTYAAESPGQALVIRHRIAEPFDFDFGNVTLQAVTLQDSSSETPLRLSGRLNGTIFELSFNTQTNRSYTVQYAEELEAGWTDLVTMPGNGTVLTVPDGDFKPRRFYRVRSD